VGVALRAWTSSTVVAGGLPPNAATPTGRTFIEGALAGFAARLAARRGPAAARAAFTSLRGQPANAYAEFPEREVDVWGYDLVSQGKLPEALEVFRLNVEIRPASWRAWDSFGETLATLGRRDEAVRAYEKSIRLYPRSLGGHDALQRLRRRHS
jgi:tetratricopeptide (TPR) repeat protein